MESTGTLADGSARTVADSASSGVTRRLAERVAAVELRDLPAAAVAATRTALEDYLGCAVAGSVTSTAAKLLDYLPEISGPGPCRIAGTSLTASAAGAALANGTLGHALDYDDVSWEMIGHPGVAIMPAILALGEAGHHSGGDVVTAYVAGFEVVSQLGMTMNRGHYERGWHATGTLGTLGAAAGSARLLGLDPDRVVAALGIAASMAAGLRANFGTDTKPLHAGRAAQHGVMAATMASRGFTASAEILEALSGFFNVYGNAPIDPERVVAQFGDPWGIADPGFNTKAYPSCMSTHAGVDAALDLTVDHDVTPAQVDAVRVGVVDLTKNILIHNNPRTGLEGKFSMQYCVARAMTDRALSVGHFTDEAVNDPGVRTLLDRVTMEVDPQVSGEWQMGTPRGALVEMTLRDGSRLAKRVDWPSGSMKNLLSRDRLDQKYRDCVSGIVPEQAREDILTALHRVESLEDIATVTTLASLGGT